jgi:hypothetical protein
MQGSIESKEIVDWDGLMVVMAFKLTGSRAPDQIMSSINHAKQ